VAADLECVMGTAQRRALFACYIADADKVLVNVINSFSDFTVEESYSLVKAHDALKSVISSMKNRGSV
jgi:hypothetical protein